MDKELTIRQERIARLEIAFDAIGKMFPRFKTQEKIAKGMRYKKKGILSDYKNPENYSDKNFQDLAVELEFFFFVNPDFLMEGKEPVIRIDPARVLEQLHDNITLLKKANEQLSTEQEKQVKELKEENKVLKEQLEKKAGKLTEFKVYSEGRDSEFYAAEKPGVYKSKKPASKGTNATENENSEDDNAPKEK